MKRIVLPLSLLIATPALALTPDQIAQQQEQARQAEDQRRELREAE